MIHYYGTKFSDVLVEWNIAGLLDYLGDNLWHCSNLTNTQCGKKRRPSQGHHCNHRRNCGYWNSTSDVGMSQPQTLWLEFNTSGVGAPSLSQPQNCGYWNSTPPVLVLPQSS
jgi:hypothetical protein